MTLTFETHKMLPSMNEIIGKHPMEIHKLRGQWAIGKRNGGAIVEINACWQRTGRPVFIVPCRLEVVHYFQGQERGRDNDNPMIKWLIDLLRAPHSTKEILSKFPHMGIIQSDSSKYLTYSQRIVEGADDTVIRGTITEQEAAE